jgi:hypothetical protein
MKEQQVPIYTMMPVEDRADFVVLAVAHALVQLLKERTKPKSRRDTRYTIIDEHLIGVLNGYKGRLPESLADVADEVLAGISKYVNQLVVASTELQEHSAPALNIPLEV